MGIMSRRRTDETRKRDKEAAKQEVKKSEPPKAAVKPKAAGK